MSHAAPIRPHRPAEQIEQDRDTVANPVVRLDRDGPLAPVVTTTVVTTTPTAEETETDDDSGRGRGRNRGRGGGDD